MACCAFAQQPKMNKYLTIACAAGAFLFVSSASAGVVFTIENAKVQASTVAGVITEDFNSFPLGPLSGSILSGAGTLTPGGSVTAPDAFGGSFASKYYAVGVQSGHTEATLSFGSPQTYFGMWWPAGDLQNHLEIYDGASLLGSYRVGDISAGLPGSYFGNPNNGLDANEPFVYLDFTVTGSSHITSVRFLNDSTGSGFEMDNFSIFDKPITPPGHNPMPDGGSTCFMLGGAALLLSLLRKRN
jgi:hypothetical protein